MSQEMIESPVSQSIDNSVLDVERLRHPDEHVSGIWMWILAIPILLLAAYISIISMGLYPAALFIIARITHLMALAYFKTNSIRVGPQQFSEIHETTTRMSARLGIAKPDVYIMQENMLNAFAARLAGKSVIILYSGLIDSMYRSETPRDLDFVIGHELGHIAAGHLSLKHRLKAVGGWFLYVGFWHRRSMEYTCDQIGLHLVGDAQAAQRAFSHLVVGGVLAGRLNQEQAQSQLREHEGEFFVRRRNLTSLYPSHLARLQRLSDLSPGHGR